MAAANATTSFGSNLGTVMVFIYVGKEEKLFVVHKALLISQSEYFKKAFSGGFIEAEENKIYLEEDDPAAAELLIAFLYLGIIPRPGAGKAPSKPLPKLPTLPPPNLASSVFPTVSPTGDSPTPYRPLDVREYSQGRTVINRHLHICHDVSYRHLSPEEIRLADYGSGREYGEPQAIAALQLQPTSAVQDSAAVYQLQMPTPRGLSLGGSWSFSPANQNLQRALLGSSTTPQIPAGSQASSPLGEAPVPSPTRSSALFGQTSPLSNPLSRVSPSPWGAGNKSFADPLDAPSTPIQNPSNATMTSQKPSVSADVPKSQSTPTVSSTALTAPGPTQALDTSTSGLTGFAKYANQPPHEATNPVPGEKSNLSAGASSFGSLPVLPQSQLKGLAKYVSQSDNGVGSSAAQSSDTLTPTPKPSTTTASVIGSPARSSDASTMKPSATATSVFGSPARSPSVSMPKAVLSIFNQLESKSHGSSLSMNIPSGPGPTATRLSEPFSAPPLQDPASYLPGFGSSPTMTHPKTGGNSVEVISKSEHVRDLVEEEIAHQEALLNLCTMAERFCWPKLFNAAIDAYVQGERSLRRDILVSHIDAIYERTHANSPLRDFVLDSMRGLEEGAITIKEHMDLAYAHEDFLKGVILKLGTSNAEKSASVFGAKPKVYHMAENTPRFGSSRHENTFTATSISRTKLTMTLSEFRSTYLSKSDKIFDKVVVGAIIHRDGGRRILLLRRAGHETYYPDMFELPSGKVEDGDATLGAALRREVAEETGLRITSVVREMQPFEYVTSKTVDGQVVYKSCLQLNFIVNVGDGEVKVNPNEHAVAVWADMVDLSRLEMTDEMRNLVGCAFRELLRDMITKDGYKET